MYHKKYSFTLGIVALLLLLQSCTATQTPTRKKMPNYLDNGLYENASPFNTKADRLDAMSLTTSTEDIMVGDASVTCVSVSLASPLYDDALLSMVQEYKPIAIMLLTNWMASGNNGAVLDFRKATSATAQEAKFVLKSEGAFTLPVVFKWDMASAGRAKTYMNMLNGVTGISVVKIK